MGELKKLEIISFKDKEFSSKIGKPFTALLNPNSIKQKLGINYSENKGIGKASNAAKFDSYNTEEISFELIFDGTGVVDTEVTDVEYEIKTLKAVVYTYNGNIHEPNYIKILWGSIEFNGRLTSLDVDYNLFKPNGSPLRAKVNLSAKQYISEVAEARLANRSSPDLTHIITIKEGDSLPLLCQDIYNDGSYYLKVAKVNGLTNIRSLEPGLKLYFPPLK